MLTYETISDALLDSADHVGLNVWQTEEHLDPQTLTRTITLHCLTQQETVPQSSSLQATIGFSWDAAMTAISTLGTEALCEKYHGRSVACSHTLSGCAYEATLTLEIAYTVPISLTVDDDLGAVQRLVSRVRETHRSIIDHKNVVAVDAKVQFDHSAPRISQIVARQRWTIGDPIHELDSLEDVLEEACSEVQNMLLALNERFSTALLPDMSDIAPIILPTDDNDDERIYLQPPAA